MDASFGFKKKIMTIKFPCCCNCIYRPAGVVSIHAAAGQGCAGVESYTSTASFVISCLISLKSVEGRDGKYLSNTSISIWNW
jgi:hypothetical protein